MTSFRLPALTALVLVAACGDSPASPGAPIDSAPAFGHVPAGPMTIGFESFNAGDDVSNPHPFLNIASLNGNSILAIWDAVSPNPGGPIAYGAWVSDSNLSGRVNGCLTDGAGFRSHPGGPNFAERHQLRFTFNGATVSDFSIRVLDYGDRVGVGEEGQSHQIAMRAYIGAAEVASDVVAGSWSGVATGDACHPVGSADKGIIDLSVSGTGIDRVDVFMESGGDAFTGYDDVSFTLEPHDPATKDDCKNGGWEAYGFRNQGQCIRFVNTGKDSR